jgi:hypothetical protein
MTELAALLVRSSIGSLRTRARCALCGRTPLPGERMHEMDSGRLVCDLCFKQLPEKERRAVRTERVRASEHHLAVGPKAA